MTPKITGILVNCYLICPRKVWLVSRQIGPSKDNIHLQLGEILRQESYERELREVHIEHLALDVVIIRDENLIIAEVKKSSKAKKAARMQLAFYLYELKRMGIEAEGELRFPEERKRERLILDESLQKEIEIVMEDIKQLLKSEKPPQPKWIGYCRNCAHSEFCWA
ncbi:CRISPR-associated protein Cas4 [Pseudothermotoga thermarum]|uniref:CRISPR-associated exonuclease Cas4 n=1 Tax=Pseudothermotoga thermarum DSM 5069 TaxID=688269 RepID=F7YTL2_9THEM|nr:CRISPR-associated protein Cas4 [Pseudothermotoga thermarum]AEH51234.1 CRISPR-associated exonuclease, Cas4 family [Pseudothermotoga thermarum DSM 5069]